MPIADALERLTRLIGSTVDMGQHLLVPCIRLARLTGLTGGHVSPPLAILKLEVDKVDGVDGVTGNNASGRRARRLVGLNGLPGI